MIIRFYLPRFKYSTDALVFLVTPKYTTFNAFINALFLPNFSIT